MDIINYMMLGVVQQNKNGLISTLFYMLIFYIFTEIKKTPSFFKPVYIKNVRHLANFICRSSSEAEEVDDKNSKLYMVYKKWLGNFYDLFRPRYTYIIEGKCWNTFNMNYQQQRIANSMSNTYIALIQYLTTFEGKKEFQTIYNLNISSARIFEDNEFDTNHKSLQEQIVPEQLIPICINKELDIHCIIHFDQYEEEGKRGNAKESGSNTVVYTIKIELFSYTSSVFTIKSFIDNITEKYIDESFNKRRDKRFIYTMLSIRGKNENGDEDDVVQKEDVICNGIVWKETPFETVKSFKTLCLKNKSAILDKINFFMNCEDWYHKHGVPYTLGIGLHGPPGTGKTSFIKSLAKHTNRHIVCISMKVILTRNQLQSVFYETKYNKNNSHIGFRDKIIVFEDIDCTGKIVMERSSTNSEDTTFENICETTGGTSRSATAGTTLAIATENESTKLLAKSLEKIILNEKEEIKKDKALTLDDLLNMWDGIRETPGRIIVITSNFYHKLDKALIRPGRIDLEIETTLDDAAEFSLITTGKSTLGVDV